MLKVYETDGKFIQSIDIPKNLCVKTTLSTGLKNLSFKLPINDFNLSLCQEERYLRYNDYEYIIKELVKDSNTYFSVYCDANIEQLTGTHIAVFDSLEFSLTKLAETAVQGTIDWTIENHSTNNTVGTYQLQYTTPYEMLETFKQDFGVEMIYDTMRKVVKIYDRIGSEKGAYFSNQLKLKLLEQQSNSYEFATKIYPIGKDGLTITEINNGRDFLENFSYTDKLIEKYWIQEDYDRAELLKADAQAYLDSICVPKRSYKASLSSFGEEIGIGDTITIVDSIKKIKEKQRVVRVTEYPYTPEKNQLELSNLIVDFSEQQRLKDSAMQKQVAFINKNLNELTARVAQLEKN